MSDFNAEEAGRVAAGLAQCDADLPEGRWEVATSNSFRRINGPDAQDGGVLCAIKQHDGHPDLSMSEENLRRLSWLRNNARSAAEQLRAAVARVQELDAHASLVETREKQATEMCSWLTKENQRLRDVVALTKHLDKDWDEMLEQSEEDCVENAQLQHMVLEACDLAGKWLAVVTGDAPVFANGDTKRSADRITAIKAALSKKETL